MRVAQVAIEIGLTSMLAACTVTPTATKFPLDVYVTDVDERPLPGAVITINRRLSGKTGADGYYRMNLEGYEGELVDMQVDCPSGYATQKPSSRLRLRRYEDVERAGEIRAIHQSFACFPTVVTAAIAVRTNGPAGLPIMVEGKKLAKTNAQGIAHMVFSARPDQRITVLIDTRSDEELVPRNPTQLLTVLPRSAIYTFEHHFSRMQRKTRRPARMRPRRLPTRIQ